jgi:nucleoside-diphosphate-sugar epimerase
MKSIQPDAYGLKVLFIGGTGTISKAVSELTLKKGFELYLFNRGNHPELIPEGAKVIKGDIRDEDSAGELLKEYRFDAVVDWVAYSPEHIQSDIRLFRDKTGQFIFISSASAYQKPSAHYLMTESIPLYNPFWQYSRDKIACEELLLNEYRNNTFPVTIVRPSYTYGERNIPFIFNSRKHRWTVIDRMIKGKKILVPGDGTSLWTITHSSDFATGFVGLLGNQQAIGHAFHITSDEVLSWNQITLAIGKAAGVEPNIIHISSDFIAALYPEAKGGLHGDKIYSLVFDNSKIKRFVPDFTATVPFSQGIRQSIKWFTSHPDECQSDEEFNRLSDRIISAYESGLRYMG